MPVHANKKNPLKTKIEWSLVFSVYSACVSSLVRNRELPLNLRIMIRKKILNWLKEWDFLLQVRVSEC